MVSGRSNRHVGAIGAAADGHSLVRNGGVRPDGGRDNPVADENQQAGDDDWLPTAPGGTRPDEANHHVEGYPAQPSVVPGEALDFHVSTDPAAAYRIDIYRLGWYDGAGGRRMASLPAQDGTARPIPDPEATTGRVACTWPVTDTLEVPTDWPTGAYLARFVATDGAQAGESTGAVFAVRASEDRAVPAAICCQLPIATSQAYNGWGGKSLYAFSSDDEALETGEVAADVVSYDRPIGGAPTRHMRYALHLVRFLEAEGYDVSYVTNLDVYRDPGLLTDHELVISAGHDEYWSANEYDAFEGARDAGTNLGFFGANIAYWQVRYEDDGRTMIGYKENAQDDPAYGTGRESDLFRNVGRPECELLGVMSVGAGLYNFPDYTVQAEATDHPWMANTGFSAGDTVDGVIGHEWDWIRPTCDPPGDLTTFFHYEQGSSDLDLTNDQDADAVAYEAPSGATVFSAGTLGVPYRLDPDPSWDRTWPYNRIQEYKPEALEPDDRLRQFVRNALADLTAGP